MQNKKIDIELLKAMMSGDYDPPSQHFIHNEAISTDLHRKSTNDSGLTFQDQLSQFEKIIDNALLNNLKQITLIHGKELHKRLRKHTHVTRYEINRNNQGETIVYL